MFREQNLGQFLDAKDEASEMLRARGVTGRKALSFEGALVLQGASHALLESDGFYARQIARLTTLRPGTVSPLLRQFEMQYGILQSNPEDRKSIPTSQRGRILRPPRLIYTPTPPGEIILALFQPNIPKR